MNYLSAATSLALALLALGQSSLAESAPIAATSGRIFQVDDTGTVVLDPSLQMRWLPINRFGASKIVTAESRVDVQLNTAAWSGYVGRIYMALRRGVGPTVRATWTTGGVMLPGSLISGDRALIYAGPLATRSLRDLLFVKLEADGSRLIEPQDLSFGFELEIDQ